MARRFDAFVMFAEMRTGSNHLEESLNALPDVTCHGEVFNPTFVGHHNRHELFGFDMARRERDPLGLLRALIDGTEGLPGFRFFHDHDPRVVEAVLSDPRIAKVILTRSPLDAYVSRKIASATGQWRLTDMKHARTSKVEFDPAEFDAMLQDWADFRDLVRRGLQVTGQSAFHIRYDDINDVEVLNGLAAFLGSDHRLPTASKRLKRQNPGSLRDKVANYPEMEVALAGMDRFGADRLVDGETPRAPGVPGFVAHPEVGLLFLPVAGAPEDSVLDWMGAIGGVGRSALLTGMSQKDLRIWMRSHPGFATFSVLRHPLPRAFRAYELLRMSGDSSSGETRAILKDRYNVPFSDGPSASRDDFAAFISFLKGNLSGQTSLRIAPEWATQMAILQGAAHVVLPQRIVLEDEAADVLGHLALSRGIDAPDLAPEPVPGEAVLRAMLDKPLARAVFDAYRRDYVHFGFGDWA
jgi:LPS sulfotransferase NodH